MRQTRDWLCMLGCCLTVAFGYAPLAFANQRLTLAQCLERALTTSPDIAEAQASIRLAESQLAQAKAGRLPQATFTSLNGIVNG
ncbi:MAG: hypothetical protein FJZ47_25085, partial [Candidatus Tectomicrobia bacterium]|nr:hypothetical protein [Candidatus Tectomicrobia bacterium]